ncbi:hypothetical protein B0H11DRAFT_1952675, partial [Mycena galericulata]
QRNIEQYYAVLSPMRRFPPEILVEIFLWTLPPSEYPWTPIFIIFSPWNISCVCSRWRSICMGLPAAWSRISVRGRKFPIRVLEAQLDRSNPHPLTINFSTEDGEPDVAAFNLLLGSSTRWRSLSLCTSDTAIFAALDALSDDIQGLPELRKLVFTTNSGVPRCKAFRSAPRLTDVVISGKNNKPLLPFPRLTRLRLHMTKSPKNLRLAQNLVHLTLISGGQPPPTHRRPIQLPQLRMLFIADGRYLDSLRLPALEDIYIVTHGICLPDFIDRSTCCLKKLTIVKDANFFPVVSEPAVDIVQILNSSPTLIEIRLGPLHQADILLRHLTIPASPLSHHTVCPQLRHLSLWDIHEDDYRMMLEMVVSRRESSPIFLSLFYICHPLWLPTERGADLKGEI